MAADKDSQLDRLNAQLRDNSSPPERDLWPGINAAITKEEKIIRQKKRGGLPGFWRPQLLWVAAAMAAFAMVLVSLDFQTNEKDVLRESVIQKMNTQVAFVQSENTLLGAIKKLEKAAQENPGDQNLSRLIRMVTSRQGDLLRHKWAENNRVQGMLNGGVS